MAKSLGELVGVQDVHEYSGVKEVRFLVGPREETIASILSWARHNEHTVTLYEETTQESSEYVMVLAEDPEGELEDWKSKL